MTVKNFLQAIGIATFFCFLCLILIILNINPYRATALGFVLFFLSLFFFLTGIFILLLFFIKIKFIEPGTPIANLISSIRQSFFLSFLLVGLLILKGLRVLDLWNAVLFILAIILIECYFRME